MTWDGYESVADAVKVLAGEGDNSGPRNQKLEITCQKVFYIELLLDN